MPQGAWAGNEFERHRSGWVKKDFSPYTIVEYSTPKDTLTKNILSMIPGVPEDLKRPTSLLVLWLQK